MRHRAYAAFALLLSFGAAEPASANDSQAEVGLGGLTLVKSDSISMDSEDLFISRDIVRVKYRFTNTSDAPVDTLVAFPLPDIPPTNEEDVSHWKDAGGVKFKTTIDGKPVAFEIVEQAFFKDRDVSAQLTAAGLPLNLLAKDFQERLKKAPKAQIDRLVADGLLTNTGSEDTPFWNSHWSLRTTITRRQVFPPKTTMTVEHEYAPLAGGSVAGNLDASRRKDKEYRQEFESVLRKYCIEKDWLASFDRIVRKRREAMAPYSEVWLSYVLKTGANWKGPIRDFRLVVDKGKPDSLVSFCMEGVRKISPTQFEARRRNFTPDHDLDILIVDWPNE